MSDYSDYSDYSDDSDENIFEEEGLLKDDEGNYYEVIEDEYTLDDFKSSINISFEHNKITDYEYECNKLFIKLKKLLKYNTFEINDDNNKKLQKLESYKNKFEKELIDEKINTDDFNRRLYIYLNSKIIILEENISVSDKAIKKDEYLTGTDLWNKYIKKEESKLKSIAKKKGIEWPKKPKETGISKDEYARQLIEYQLKLNKAENEAKIYMQGYVMNYLDKKWDEIPAKTSLYDDDNSDDISPVVSDPALDLILNDLSIKLKTLTKESLIKCIENHNIKIESKISYIEKLKNNTVKILKFKEYPDTYEKLKEILSNESKYYKVPEKIFLQDFDKEFYEPELLKTNKSKFNVIKQVKINGKLIDVEGIFLLKINKSVNKSKFKNYNKYLQKGSTISLSLKKEYFKKNIDIFVVDEQYFDIIKPIPDELYYELMKNKKTEGNKTNISKVWELHVNVEGIQNKIVKRYNDFTDYLRDLLEILQDNFKQLETNKDLITADVIHKKILKINYFLEKGIDGELEIEGNYSVTDTITLDKIIIEQRKASINQLREYVLQYYPENEHIVETLESNIFNYNNKNYLNNIQKVLFIFKNYENTLEQYVSGNISYIELITFELPLNIIKDDFKDKSNEEILQYLELWKPESEFYIQYKSLLDKYMMI